MSTLLEAFVDELDADLSKRAREISDLRLMVASSTGARLDLVARACHVMAYAHWEGFVKHALRSYLGYLLTRSLRVGSLKYGLQGLALRDAMRIAAEPERTVEKIADLLPRLDSRAAQPFSVIPSEVIKTGNMDSTNFRALLGCVGLEYLTTYQTRENFIDSVVCGRRHRIAHGEWQPISSGQARSVASDVLDLCNDVNYQIQNAAIYDEYFL